MPARLVVFGDSIAAGMGARGRSFPVLVADELGIELVDFTSTAAPVGWTARNAGEVRGDDLVLIAHGSTEALRRPSEHALRLVPGRWRKPGWLDPRPYFSTGRLKGLGQRLESGIRWRVKVLLMRAFGATQWHTPERYEEKLEGLVAQLKCEGVAILDVLPVDDRFFPGSPAELRRFAAISRAVAERHGATFVELDGVCRPWQDFCDDHFHPNEEGHRKVAERIVARLPSGPDHG